MFSPCILDNVILISTLSNWMTRREYNGRISLDWSGIVSQLHKDHPFSSFGSNKVSPKEGLVRKQNQDVLKVTRCSIQLAMHFKLILEQFMSSTTCQSPRPSTRPSERCNSCVLTYCKYYWCKAISKTKAMTRPCSRHTAGG